MTKKENKYEVIFVNGSAKAKATTLIKAIKKMKIKKNAEVGLLVQVRENGIASFLDGRVFIKHSSLKPFYDLGKTKLQDGNA